MLMSHVMLIATRTRRQGEFNFLIQQDAWLAGQGIVLSAYSLKGSVPSKHHVIPLSSADADSGADYTEITILVPELDARPSSRSTTSCSSYDVGSGDLSPCDADDAVSTSSDAAAVADAAGGGVHHVQQVAVGDHFQPPPDSSSRDGADTKNAADDNSNYDMCEWDHIDSFGYSLTAMRQAVQHSVAANCYSLKYSIYHLWTRACAAASSTVTSIQIRSVEQFQHAKSSVQTAATDLQLAVQQQLHSTTTAVANSIRTHTSAQQCALASIGSICSISQRVHHLEICSSYMQSAYQCTTNDVLIVSVLFISTVMTMLGVLLAVKRRKIRCKAAAVVSTTVTVHHNASNDTDQQQQQQQQQQHRKRIHTTALASRSNGNSSGGLGLNSVMMMLDDELAGTALVACDSAEQRPHGASSSTRSNRHPFS
jgi:hypothetical protein